MTVILGSRGSILVTAFELADMLFLFPTLHLPMKVSRILIMLLL